jgi:thiamine-monophosphate kinase
MALRGLAHAAIDVSDGVAGDLRHVLAASSSGGSLGADLVAADIPLDPCLSALPIEEALRHALTGGDDYEILFTAAPEKHQAIRALCPTAGMMGRLRIGSGILLSGGDGRTMALEGTGYDHFS